MGANTSNPDSTKSPEPLARNSQMSMSADSDSGILSRNDKKKKTSKLTTLRKKLSRVGRQSRYCDYGKALRELTSTWSIREMHSLADEYEASSALKELTIIANLARPHTNSVVEDLANLFEQKYCADVKLIYQGTVIPAHRALLCVRCVFFRELLGRYPEYGAQVTVTLRTPGVTVNLFLALLRYLYTGNFGLDEACLHSLKKLLTQIVAEFGAPNSLEQDLRTLLDTGPYSDALLVFSEPSSNQSSYASALSNATGSFRGACPHVACPHSSQSASASLRVSAHTTNRGDGTLSLIRRYRNELRCHRAILAARSSFFRSMEQRRTRSEENSTSESSSCIVLDESIIPKRFARVLLGAIYLNTVDLSTVIRSSVSVPVLGDTTGSSNTGSTAGSGPTLVEEAMELYHIGRFLEISTLSHGCEDIIAENLSVENLAMVLQWSSEPHGSAWVLRQAMHFLREEFLQISNSPMIGELSKSHLSEAIRSDFLQAREIDVLAAVIKWAEYKLVRRLEEREPNLVSHTAHSISRKGIKKKDLNDVELREILADLLPHVRTSHILPAHSDLLASAVKRGLVSVPPAHLLGGSEYTTASAWVRTRNLSLFVKPRLFMPYYDELKTIMKEQSAKAHDSSAGVQLQVVHMCTKPDALYMLEDKMYAVSTSQVLSQQNVQSVHWPGCPSATVDIIAAAIPVPDNSVLTAMQQRTTELMHSKSAQRAYVLHSSNRAAVTHQIHLRVVREFGMPNSAIQLLQDMSCRAVRHHEVIGPGSGAVLESTKSQCGACYISPALRRGGRSRSTGVSRCPSTDKSSHAYEAAGQIWTPAAEDLDLLGGAPGDGAYLQYVEASASRSNTLLRKGMPDVAMATGRLSLEDQQDYLDDSLLLAPPGGDLGMSTPDLGDRASHRRQHHTGTGGSRSSSSQGSMHM